MHPLERWVILCHIQSPRWELLSFPRLRTLSRTRTSRPRPILCPRAPLSPPVVRSGSLLPLALTCRSDSPSDRATAVAPALTLCILPFLSVTIQLASLHLHRPSFLSESLPCLTDLILENRQDCHLLTRPNPSLVTREFNKSTALLFPGKLFD